MAWQPDTEAGAFRVDSPLNDANGWPADHSQDNDGPWSPSNISKHDDGFGATAADPGLCFACNEPGHTKRDCPNRPANDGLCYSCGQEGHSKPDCPTKPANDGACYSCGEQGHSKRDCPSKPPMTCRVCKQEGHIAAECTANRLFQHFKLDVEGLDADAAWELVKAADQQKDMKEVEKAIIKYAMTAPTLTFPAIEEVLREEKMNTYLIAKEQDIGDMHTIVDLQGQCDKKYVLSIQLSPKPRRARTAAGWPSSPEENLARLAEAGFVLGRLTTKCYNCGELGHTSRNCTQEKQEPVRAKIECYYCQGPHRARDCTQPRPQREPKQAMACHNCGSEEHKAKDCPEERVMTCRNCDGKGHAARDCPEPRNMAKVQCRNCDEYGHTGKECPKPRDYSRVQCSNCQQMGHTQVRCKAPKAESANGDGGGDWDAPSGGATSGGGGGGWDAPTNGSSGGDAGWGGAPAAASGGW